MKHIAGLLPVFVLIVMFDTQCSASREGPWPDDIEIIERSDLIVIGHLQEGSIKFIPKYPVFEHGATLIVTKVLKGTVQGKEIPIVFNDSVIPLIGGYSVFEKKNGKYTSKNFIQAYQQVQK